MEFRHVSRREYSRRIEHRGVQSDMVNNDFIQDRGAKLQIVGSDVAALYPSLKAVEVAKIVYNVNYTEACQLIALTSTGQDCRMGQLKRVLPRRRSNKGTRPGITG